jgi:hypothetical protein
VGISVSMMKLKVHYMTAENSSLARAERTKRKPIGTFFNMLEKVATENNPSGTSGNIFSICGSGVQIINKPGFVKT